MAKNLLLTHKEDEEEKGEWYKERIFEEDSSGQSCAMNLKFPLNWKKNICP